LIGGGRKLTKRKSKVEKMYLLKRITHPLNEICQPLSALCAEL
jgi:hypothetical protein